MASTRVSEERLPADLESRIGQFMVGRAAETERFQEQFDRMLDGCIGLVLIHGQPGIGKTFFVQHAAPLFSGGATFLYGKFEQYGDKPLAAWAEVTEQAVRHLLTLPTEPLEQIRAVLNKKLGANASILLSVCPYARMLLGDRKALRADSLGQIRYRVRKAFNLFLSAVSTTLFPLVVFLDDLQWADDLSLQVLDSLCKGDEAGLLLVLASREDGTGALPPFPARLGKAGAESIGLGPLSYEDVENYLALVFGDSIEHPDYPARILYGLSLGNPFLISRILRLLLQNGALSRPAGAGKWLFKPAYLNLQKLPSDIGQLLRQQINGLCAEDRQLLELIACYGGTASLDLLQSLTDTGKPALCMSLDRLCANALLVKRESNDLAEPGGMMYGFVHDIVLRLVYNGLSPEEQSKRHYMIASRLTEPLAAAVHLLRADPALLYQEPEKWELVLYRAGLEARETPAVEHALALFERCVDLMRGREEETSSARDVRLNLAECLFICEHVADARRQFEALLAEYSGTEDQLRIKRRYINLCACNGDFEKVMALGFQILKDLHFEMNLKRPLLLDLIKSRLLLNPGKISRVKNAPEITDERSLCILETLTVMILAANRIDDRLSALFSLKLAILSARYGNSPYAPTAYAAYCYVLFFTLRDHKTGKRLEKVVLDMIEDCPSHESKSTALFILGAFTRHWTNTLADSVRCLEYSIAEGEKAGASLYGSYAIAFTVITRYMAGGPLAELEQYIADCRTRPKRLEHYITLFIWDIYEDHIARFRQGSAPEREAPLEDDGDCTDKKLFANTMKLTENIVKLEQLYLEGKVEEAYALTVSLAPIMISIQGFVLDVEHSFYNVLTRLARYPALSGKERRINRLAIKKHLKELEYCVRVNKSNHYARYLLAKAEYNALFMGGKDADALYQRAMASAEASGNLSVEALAYRLAASHHRGNAKLARLYAEESARLYRRWGADFIAGLVEREAGLPQIAESAPADTCLPDRDDRPAPMGLAYHLGVIEPMGEDEGYVYLLDLLVRSGRADYCAVFFEKLDTLYLKYEKRQEEDVRIHAEPVSMNYLNALPHRILRYTARTETEVILSPSAPCGIFENDAFLTSCGGLGLACLPMRYSGVFVGVVYLEKAGPNGLEDNLLLFVKGFIPMLLGKKPPVGGTGAWGARKPEALSNLFTAREMEVFRLMLQGKSNAAIGDELHITLGTVRNHLSSIFAKLEVDNRVKAVLRAGELGIR
jgi:predicted ATPase/DNA-binding CsgD family transcriptional regulator